MNKFLVSILSCSMSVMVGVAEAASTQSSLSGDIYNAWGSTVQVSSTFSQDDVVFRPAQIPNTVWGEFVVQLSPRTANPSHPTVISIQDDKNNKCNVFVTLVYDETKQRNIASFGVDNLSPNPNFCHAMTAGNRGVVLGNTGKV